MDTATGFISGTPTAASSSTLTMTVTDSTSQALTADFDVNVTAPPPITLTSNPAPSAGENTITNEAASKTPVTATGGFPPLLFAISSPATGLPTGLEFSNSTGQITGTATAKSAVVTYTVTVSDSANQSETSDFKLKITNPPLIVTPTAPSYELTRTLALSEPLTLATITGGSGTSTDAIAEALPAGLTLDNGRLIGTPTTTAAVATFTYTVTDSDTALTAQSFTFTITISDPPALDIEANGGITTKTFFRGATDTFTPAAFVGTSTGFGDKTFAISSPATGLPNGLSLDPATGVISGDPIVLSGAHAATPTPPAASYTIKVTDSFTTPQED
mgnify:FL=1